MSVTPSPSTSPLHLPLPGEVFWVFLRLGLTSFGGPVAHLGYFRDEFVVRRRWLTEHSYADLVALCQFLPGPASSQVGMALGLMRGGWGGALAAWVGFTLPSALALALLGLGFSAGGFGMPAGLVQGLKVVAVAVVAQAVWAWPVGCVPRWAGGVDAGRLCRDLAGRRGARVVGQLAVHVGAGCWGGGLGPWLMRCQVR